MRIAFLASLVVAAAAAAVAGRSPAAQAPAAEEQSMKGKVVLITGSTDGLGREVALRVAALGAQVLVHGRNQERGAAVVKEIEEGGKGSARFYAADLASLAQVRTLADTVRRDHPRLDVLVNNAGVWHTGGLLETSPEDFRRVVEINQTGVFLGMRAVAPLMREQGAGSIINISSAAGLRGDPLIHAYVASKWAVRGMTKAAALELAPFGVRVNSVHPGLIQTSMSATEFEPGKPDPGRDIPMGRVGQPEEVAEMVAFLATGASAYVTGAELAIDGGVTA